MSSAYVVLVAIVASFAGFLLGYDALVIVGGQLFWRPYFELSGTTYGLAMAVAVIGCIMGPSLGLVLIDQMGRRTTLMCCAVLWGIGSLGTAMADEIAIFMVFRVVTGLAIGLSSVASPMYIAEVAPSRLRGRLGLLYQAAITVGATISVCVCWWLSRLVEEGLADSDLVWRYMFGSELVPIVVFFLLLPMLPRSPRWVAKQGREAEAEQLLARICGVEAAQTAMEEIRFDLNQEDGKWSELLQGGMRKALLCACLLALFNNLTGWSGVAFYMPEIFSLGGYARPSQAIFNTLLLNVFNLFFALLSIALVDRIGRRPLWILTSAMMIAALAFAAVAFHLAWTGPIIVLVVVLTAIPHQLGLGPLPWLMQSELFPTRLRAKGVCISTTTLWFGGFLSAYLFPVAAEWSEHLVGSISVFFAFFAGVCILSLIFGIYLLPETKNRSLEEIAASWDNAND